MRYNLWIIACLIAIQFSAPRLYAVTYLVSSTADAGAGTLREAITLANANPGADVINFDFGLAGVKTITLLSDLPVISSQLFIDGSSDPYYAGAPVVEINVNGQKRGLDINTGGGFTHIHALIINNANGSFNSAGIYIFGVDDVRITGCYIGTDASGTIAIPNTTGISAWSADRLIVGGTGLNEGNLVSGNDNDGLSIWDADDVLIYGNKIGTDVNGTSSLPNNLGGVNISNCLRAIVGGATADHRNLISGNTIKGLGLNSQGSNKVYGNFVGTDISGTMAIPNGIGIQVVSANTEIGGALPGQGNLISGNLQNGLAIFSTSEITVKGNLVGTDITGTLALPNQRDGINLHAAKRTNIGGLTPADRNIISGNGMHGILMFTSDSISICGNYIGTDMTGTNPLPNQLNGIHNTRSFHNYIGNGTAAGANVVSGNGSMGIRITGGTNRMDSIIIKHNYIGTDPTGLINLANTNYGISINGGSQGNVIGGIHSGEGNFIANNLQGGVSIEAATTTSNQILGNSIYDHPLPGIRLNGGNNNQEAPELTGFIAGPSTTTILGSFNSAPNTTYRLEFFTSNTANQGKTFIGTTTISTDATGFYALNEIIPVTVTAAEPVLTATATDPNANTSPFGIEAVLNVSLHSFTVASLPLGKALLTWETEGQDPNAYFEIEHQAPSHDFTLIGRQDVYVSLNQGKMYQYEVENLVSGKHYFRVVQISEGGLRRYSRSLELEVTQEASHQVWIPNPMSSTSILRINVQKTQKIQIHLLDISGKRLSKLFSGEIAAGTDRPINLGGLAKVSKGMYVLNIEGIDVRLNQKVLVE